MIRIDSDNDNGDDDNCDYGYQEEEEEEAEEGGREGGGGGGGGRGGEDDDDGDDKREEEWKAASVSAAEVEDEVENVNSITISFCSSFVFRRVHGIFITLATESIIRQDYIMIKYRQNC